MILIQDRHNHLESGLLLYGQDLLDTACHHLQAASLQLLLSLAEDDIQFHMGSSAYAVNDQQHLIAGFWL